MSDAREALVALPGEGEQPGCTGAGDCPATAHTHGCYADTEGHCEHPEEHGWTPPAARCCDPETIETRIDGDWLVDVHQHHTCGTGPDGHYGAHEPGCGKVPVVNLRGLPGWTPPGERVKPSVEDVARALADDWNPDRDPILTAMFRDYAQTVLALFPGRTEAEVKAEGWDEGLRAGEAFERARWQWSAGATARVVNGLAERPERPANPYRKEAEHG